jgi:3-deoxy-D-arabino-heptulosonate 7-phosphate (DAHP) synthase
MIEFEKEYRFSNDWSCYVAKAKTYEGHTGYGNDTSLEVSLESDTGLYVESLLYDLRYTGMHTPEEIDEFVRYELAAKFRARFE